MELGCVPEANSSHWDVPQGSWRESLVAGIRMKSGAAWLEREWIFCPMAARSLRAGTAFFQQRQNASSCAASFKSMAPWQTVVHDLRRTYCKTPLATLECWCPEERTGCWGRSREAAAGLLQAQSPTRQHSPSRSAVLWPLSAAGQGGQEAGTSSAPTGQVSVRASHSVQQVVNGKQALTDAHNWAKHVAKTEAHSFLRHQRSGAKATTAYYFAPGRSCSQAALLGDSHCPLPTWCTASKPPLTPCQSARAVALGPFDYTA